MQGKIIKGIAGFYYVYAEDGNTYECRAKGIFRKDKFKPLVGDNVDITVLDEKELEGSVTEIHKRKNSLIRPAVANVDQALVIFAMDNPKPNFMLLDRFLIMMEREDVPAVICFNKKDLATAEELETLPGVGAILAERIVSYREAVGGFQTLEELQQVNGIGSGIYSQIAPYLFIIGELQTISPEPDTQPSESSEPTMPEEKTASDSESIPHLDINIATAEDFQKLPNVTPEQAEAIVRLRTQIQYFQNIYELLYADGMTDRLFLSIRDYLYVSFA